MRKQLIVFLIALSFIVAPAMVGCNRTISEEKTEKVNPNTGEKTVKEKKVEQTPDGGTKTTEEKRKENPNP